MIKNNTEASFHFGEHKDKTLEELQELSRIYNEEQLEVYKSKNKNV